MSNLLLQNLNDVFIRQQIYINIFCYMMLQHLHDLSLVHNSITIPNLGQVVMFNEKYMYKLLLFYFILFWCSLEHNKMASAIIFKYMKWHRYYRQVLGPRNSRIFIF